MESLAFNGGAITAVPFLGEHADLDVRAKAGYAVRIGRRIILFLADSDNVEPRLYRHVPPKVGTPDALFLGMECDGAPLSLHYA